MTQLLESKGDISVESVIETKFLRWSRQVALWMTRPPALAFIPALGLAMIWFGVVGATLVLISIVPALYLYQGHLQRSVNRLLTAPEPNPVMLGYDIFEEGIEQVISQVESKDLKSSIFCVEIDNFQDLCDQYGRSTMQKVAKCIGKRLLASVRDIDLVCQRNDGQFAVCLAPVHHLNPVLCGSMADRLQQTLEDPLRTDDEEIPISVSIGFCLISSAAEVSSTEWLEHSITALAKARKRGPSSIERLSMQAHASPPVSPADTQDIQHALRSGQIQPWFQPQISTHTGEISGFEALARWVHPSRGVILPSDFLPLVAQANLFEPLAEAMMRSSFAALKAWDNAGFSVPRIGVNFSGPELSNPKLIEKIKWELDHFDLTPDRLAIEILETVVSNTDDDIITRNIRRLEQLGCGIDLDDFGTGHASIGAIHQFGVSRIKIDRSFVARADRCSNQKQVINAILAMAEHFGVETLAEGVETVGEHATLAQLGCDHVQGFGIARAMPFEQTLLWIPQNSAKIQHMPKLIGRNR